MLTHSTHYISRDLILLREYFISCSWGIRQQKQTNKNTSKNTLRELFKYLNRNSIIPFLPCGNARLQWWLMDPLGDCESESPSRPHEPPSAIFVSHGSLSSFIYWGYFFILKMLQIPHQKDLLLLFKFFVPNPSSMFTGPACPGRLTSISKLDAESYIPKYVRHILNYIGKLLGYMHDVNFVGLIMQEKKHNLLQAAIFDRSICARDSGIKMLFLATGSGFNYFLNWL